MTCTGCNGGGCQDCGDQGEILINCCPLEMIDAEIVELIELAQLFKKGLPPVAGGTLDQTRYFLGLAAFVFSEIDYWKNKNLSLDP